ncbi:MAG TPA: glycine zipper 2TM domain-containing protein [Allosphingosinicella sp.]|nr:glycine zipper 2TM domain-containing protein [Allosphingosinicella sp.]
MKALLASAAIMASMLAIAPAMPAAAQPYQNGWNSNEFWRGAPADPWERIQYLQNRIDRGISDGSLDRREAYRAQSRLRQIRQDAWQMRRRNGDRLSGRDAADLQARLDDLSRSLRWMRHNGERGYGGGGYAARGNFETDYDASRYYRDDPRYQERRLGANDEVYRGSDGRYYCKRNDGTTGLIVGGASGALLGNVIDGGHNRVAGTLIGGALGALIGKSVDQNTDVRCR